MILEFARPLEPIITRVCSILPSLEKKGPVLSEIKSILKSIEVIITTLAEMLGFGPTNIEQLGAKAEHSGLSPDDFENYDDYIEALDQFQIEPEEVEKIPQEVRLARGISLLLQQIESRFPVGIDNLLPELVTGQHSNFFSPTRIAALLDSFSRADLSMRDMVAYFDNELGVLDTIKVEGAMLIAEKILKENTGKDDSEMIETIQQQRR